MPWWRFALLSAFAAVCMMSLCELSRASLTTSSAIAGHLDKYMAMMKVLDQYHADTVITTGTTLANQVNPVVDDFARQVPDYVIEGLPYPDYLRKARYNGNWVLNSVRPNLIHKIKKAAEAWMCACLVDEIAFEIDRLYAAELLTSDKYEDTDKGMQELQLDIRDHIEWIHEIKRINLHLQTDTQHLKLYEHLYDTCVAKNLANISPK